MKIILLIILFSYLLFEVDSHEGCGLKFLKVPKRKYLSINSSNNKIEYRKGNANIDDEWAPIRIHLDYSGIEENKGKFNKTDLIYLRDKIMSKAKEVFEKLIKVRRFKKKLQLNTDKCDDGKIPEFYKEKGGGGVDADIVIFVSLDDTGFYKANKIEAAATYCLQDENSKRPIAGFINFRPNININSSRNLDYMIWLALHEMTHIFVFNDGLYEDFIDENMNNYKFSDIVGSKLLKNNKKINFIKTKKLLEKAKKHFNCPDLEGVPLEFMGGAGTAGSHWSKRAMNTDYMIGDSYGENLISEITLALFEDSGWYKVDYENSNLFLWGKNEGCGFLNMEKKCVREKNYNFNENNISYNSTSLNSSIYNATEKEENFYEGFFNTKKPKLGGNDKNKNVIFSKNKYEDKKSEERDDKEKTKVNNSFNFDNYETDYNKEFCTKPNYPICSNSHIFRGNCRVKRYSHPLSASETYFSDKFIGGLSKLANKCPIAIEDKTNFQYYSGSCRRGTYRDYQLAIEKICPECACFMSNLVPIKKIKQDVSIDFTNATLVSKAGLNSTNSLSSSSQANTNNDSNDNSNNANENISIIGEGRKNLKSNIDFTFVTISSLDIKLPYQEDKKEIEKETKKEKRKYLRFKQIDNKANLKEKLNTLNSLIDQEKDSFENEEEEENDLNAKLYKKNNLPFRTKKDSAVNQMDLYPVLTEEDYKAMCFEFKCKENDLYVMINDVEYKCINNKITLNDYKGEIVCPPSDIICSKKYLCKFGCTEKYHN